MNTRNEGSGEPQTRTDDPAQRGCINDTPVAYSDRVTDRNDAVGSNDPDKMRIADAAISYLNSIDFHLVMETLSCAMYDRLFSVLKDYGAEDDDGIRFAVSQGWHITHLMAFIAELYHWNGLRNEKKMLRSSTNVVQ